MIPASDSLSLHVSLLFCISLFLVLLFARSLCPSLFSPSQALSFSDSLLPNPLPRPPLLHLALSLTLVVVLALYRRSFSLTCPLSHTTSLYQTHSLYLFQTRKLYLCLSNSQTLSEALSIARSLSLSHICIYIYTYICI